MRFFHALDFDFADGIAHPLGSFRLCRLQEDFCGRLGQHHLSHMAINHFELRLPLEAQNDRILALAVFGDCRMELGEPL